MQAVNLPYSLNINSDGTFKLSAEGENISQYDYSTGKPLEGAKEKSTGQAALSLVNGLTTSTIELKSYSMKNTIPKFTTAAILVLL